MTDNNTTPSDYRRIQLLAAYVNSLRDAEKHIANALMLIEQETGLSAEEAARSPLAHHENKTIQRARTFARRAVITSDFPERVQGAVDTAVAMANRLSEVTADNDGRLPLLDTGLSPDVFVGEVRCKSVRFCTAMLVDGKVMSSNPTVALEELED